ncbi:MAG: hypothetical protein V4787_04260 [Pseudomonadota bacterium]
MNSNIIAIAIAPLLAASMWVHAAPPDPVPQEKAAAAMVRVEKHEQKTEEKASSKAEKKSANVAVQSGKPQPAPDK